MNWNQIKDRWAAITWSGTAPFALPTVVLEIQPDFVMGVRLHAKGKGSRTAHRGAPVMLRLGVSELESDTLRPILGEPNIANREELIRGLRSVIEVVGNGSGQLGLLVPDGMVRVGTLPFETLPPSRREAEALIRWRMKESLPFPPEEARISYQVTSQEEGRMELVTMAARNSVLGEYQGALEQFNGGPVLILPATAALLPLLSEGDRIGQVLIHVCSGWVTHVVLAGSRLGLWRTREVAQAGPDCLIDAVTAETSRVIAAAGDRLNVEISRVWLCARPAATPDLAPEIERAISRQVDLLSPDPSFAAMLSSEEQRAFECYGATVAGLAANSSQQSP